MCYVFLLFFDVLCLLRRKLHAAFAVLAPLNFLEKASEKNKPMSMFKTKLFSFFSPVKTMPVIIFLLCSCHCEKTWKAGL